ncbi:piggyBac transposable element-derived protein 3-like [Microplitis mediator]|uniref:piggyBac transposable element-derived protein 3-like n=1 Tax=Microplitis mediator TaxID=375433 RepID=UPI0025574E7C|nr:piggyBac transposable element-derived protein 3-like [Microplitis mediator]
MGFSRFYGTSKHVNIIPGDGSLSDDDISFNSDDDFEPNSIRQPHKSRTVISESESDFSDVENVPLLNSQTASTSKAKGKSAKKDWFIWKKGKMPASDSDNFKFKGNSELPEAIMQLDTSAEVFQFLFTSDMIDFIAEQSNLKSIQENIDKPVGIRKEEIEQFIGIVIFMSCVKLPAARMYWTKHVGQPQVYDVMTCNRFEAIKRFLHFNNNENFIPRDKDGHDKLFKIRRILDMIRKRLMLVPKEEFLSVDEQIIPTKCRHELKQYNPAKPNKWGYKNHVLSGVSGFSYDFEIFAGKQSNSHPSDAPDLGVSSNVVTRLTSTVPRHRNFKICFDNWFNSPRLQVYLYKNGLLPLGTVRLNCVLNSNMPTEKELKKRGRGSMEEKIAVIDNVKLSLVSWFDNKNVSLLSAYVGSEPTTTKRRYVRHEKKYKDISCPQAVDVYNQHMGGVDLLVSVCSVTTEFIYDLVSVSEHLRKVGRAHIPNKRGRRPSILGAPTSSRGDTPMSLPNSPIPTKKPRKTPVRHQDIPLDSTIME